MTREVQAGLREQAPTGASQRARSQTRKLAAVVEASREFIGLAAPDGSVLYANPAALALLGIAANSP